MSFIFSHIPPTGPKPKTHISLGSLPAYIDPGQPPSKRSPWRQIQSQPSISSLTVTTPSSLYNTIWPHITPTAPTHYAKVILTLTDILTGAFFTEHIKKGNILLLSEGTPGVSDWICTLHDGQLKLELAKEIYERCGLQGVPSDRNGGARKHGRDRWTVELDLRSPAMVTGRNGFERLTKAAREVLNQGRVWLFRDLDEPQNHLQEREEQSDQQPTHAFHPTIVELVPQIREMTNVLVPTMVSTSHNTAVTTAPPPLELHDDYHELVEWLDLVQLASPRVLASDDPDPYISRYTVPDAETATATDLTVLTWTGLLDRKWCTRLVIEMVRLSRKMKVSEWLAFAVAAHRTEALGQVQGSTTLLQPGVGSSVEHDADEMDVDKSSDQVVDTISQPTSVAGGLHNFVCFEFVDAVVT